MNKKVLIIGAGPAGLTCGYQISKSDNFDSVIVEVTDHVGGMARSIRLFNRILDLGPHRFFSSDTRVNSLWLEVIGEDYKIVKRLTRIYYRGKFFDYPLRPLNAFVKLGVLTSLLCFLSYLKYVLFPIKDTSTFSNWVINRFGKKLYTIFFKSYTEKLWGIRPDLLSSEFAKQRIKNFSLGEAFLQLFKKKLHRTLVDQFAYPLNGNGDVYVKMKKRYTDQGGKILFNTSISEVTFESGKYNVTLSDGTQDTFDYLVSSMPIDSFLDLFTNYQAPNRIRLTFRNTILVYTKVKQNQLFDDQWLYLQDDNVRSGRITNFNNWVEEVINNEEGTVLINEYWANDPDEIWRSSDQELFEICQKDLKTCKFVEKSDDILEQHVIRIPKCYPVYANDYQSELNSIRQQLDSFENLSFIGRSGSFKYNNQDHSILMGILCAENIVEKQDNDLWEINTDYNYHEASLISETGLVKIEQPS